MECFIVQLANLSISVDHENLRQNYFFPETLKIFSRSAVDTQAGKFYLNDQEKLILHLREEKAFMIDPACQPLYRSDTWDAWKDPVGNFVFSVPNQKPVRHAVINADFSDGDVIINPSTVDESPYYPLEHLDIRIISAWLGTKGDLMLHASGVVMDGVGYCFIGESGAGKSTLVANFAKDPAYTVLGEDQVILRYLDGQFWIFGTPWHTNPALCSPLGAPLKKMFFLDRALPAGVKVVKPAEGVTRVLQTAFVPYYLPEHLPGILDRLSLLAERVPFYSLSYRLGTNPIPLIR